MLYPCFHEALELTSVDQTNPLLYVMHFLPLLRYSISRIVQKSEDKFAFVK